jgi:hypothetical protein
MLQNKDPRITRRTRQTSRNEPDDSIECARSEPQTLSHVLQEEVALDLTLDSHICVAGINTRTHTHTHTQPPEWLADALSMDWLMSMPTHTWPASSSSSPLSPEPHPMSSTYDGWPSGRFSNSMARCDMRAWMSMTRELLADMRTPDITSSNHHSEWNAQIMHVCLSNRMLESSQAARLPIESHAQIITDCTSAYRIACSNHHRLHVCLSNRMLKSSQVAQRHRLFRSIMGWIAHSQSKSSQFAVYLSNHQMHRANRHKLLASLPSRIDVHQASSHNACKSLVGDVLVRVLGCFVVIVELQSSTVSMYIPHDTTQCVPAWCGAAYNLWRREQLRPRHVFCVVR